MVLEYDENLESLVESAVPRLTEVRVRKARFSKPDASTIKRASSSKWNETSNAESWPQKQTQRRVGL